MKSTLITEMIALRQLKMCGNVSTNVYAKFHCALLRIKKASGFLEN